MSERMEDNNIKVNLKRFIMKLKLQFTLLFTLLFTIGFSQKKIEIGETYSLNLKNITHYVTVVNYKEKKEEVTVEFHDDPSLNGKYHKAQLRKVEAAYDWMKVLKVEEGTVVLARKNTNDEYIEVKILKSYIDGMYLAETKDGKKDYFFGGEGSMKLYENLTTSGKYKVGQKIEVNYNGFYRRARIVELQETKIIVDKLSTIAEEKDVIEPEKVREAKEWEPIFSEGSLCESRIDIAWEPGVVKSWNVEKEQYLVTEDNSQKDVWVTADNIRLPKKYVNYAGATHGTSLNGGGESVTLYNDCGADMNLYINGYSQKVMDGMELYINVAVGDKIYLDAGGYEGDLILIINESHIGSEVNICK